MYRLLIIEDEKDIAQSIASFASSYGFETKTIEDFSKIMAHLRRSYDFNTNPNIISHNGIDLNINDSSVIYENKHLELSKNEFRILLTLVQNKGKIVSREKLMEVLWQSGDFIDENTLNVNINRLRKKLETINIKNLIQTKFGMGYLMSTTHD